MSEGPIKRERESGRPPGIPAAPQLGDVVNIDPAPAGHQPWRIDRATSTALAPHDVVGLTCLDPESPVRRVNRYVHQTSPHA